MFTKMFHAVINVISNHYGLAKKSEQSYAPSQAALPSITEQSENNFTPISHSRRSSFSNNIQETSEFETLFFEKENNNLETLSNEQLIKHIKAQEEKLLIKERLHLQTKRQLQETEEHLQYTTQYITELEKAQEALSRMEEEKNLSAKKHDQLHYDALALCEKLTLVTNSNTSLRTENTTLVEANIAARKEIAKIQQTVRKRDWVKWGCAFLIVVGLGLCCTGIGAAVGAPILAVVTTVLSVVGTGASAGGAGTLVIGSAAVLIYRHQKQSDKIKSAFANVENQLPSTNVAPNVNSQARALNKVRQQSAPVKVNTQAKSNNKAKPNNSSFFSGFSCCFWRSPVAVGQDVYTKHQQANNPNTTLVM